MKCSPKQALNGGKVSASSQNTACVLMVARLTVGQQTQFFLHNLNDNFSGQQTPAHKWEHLH